MPPRYWHHQSYSLDKRIEAFLWSLLQMIKLCDSSRQLLHTKVGQRHSQVGQCSTFPHHSRHFGDRPVQNGQWKRSQIVSVTFKRQYWYIRMLHRLENALQLLGEQHLVLCSCKLAVRFDSKAQCNPFLYIFSDYRGNVRIVLKVLKVSRLTLTLTSRHFFRILSPTLCLLPQPGMVWWLVGRMTLPRSFGIRWVPPSRFFSRRVLPVQKIRADHC